MADGPLAGLHIVLIPTWYPTPEAPTGGRLFKEYIEAFAGAGARVGLLYPDLVDIPNWIHFSTRAGYWERVRSMGLLPTLWPTLREETDAGAPVVRVRGAQLRQREHRIDKFAAWLERAYRHYVSRHGAPDILNPHCAVPAGWGALRLADELTPRPRVVLTEHTGPFSLLLKTPGVAQRTLSACREADALAAVGSLLRKEMQQAGVQRDIEIIPNAAASSFHFVDIPPPGRSPSGKRRYGAVFAGRYSKLKGIPELAVAIERLAQAPDVEVFWHFFGFAQPGEEEEEERLRRVLSSGPAAGMGTIHGIKDREEIARVMRESHFSILPSHRDNCPLAVVESLSMGRPVVGTDDTGVEYFVRPPGDGVLCRPNDPDDLTRAILECLRTEWSARDIAAHAEARFSGPAIADQYAKLFRP
jgi:glycosyltransferase involved in cell wall biosynthesis